MRHIETVHAGSVGVPVEEIKVPEFALRRGEAGCCGGCAQTMALIRAGGNLAGQTVQGITILLDTENVEKNSKVYLCRCNHCGGQFTTRLAEFRKGMVVACPECAKNLPPPIELRRKR